MVPADVARAAIAMGLAFSHGSLWAIYLAAFGLSSFAVFFNPAAASVVPALVEEDDVVGANSALWSAAVVSQIVLAPVAGALVGFAGPGIAFGYQRHHVPSFRHSVGSAAPRAGRARSR
jgi:MFS family permease